MCEKGDLAFMPELGPHGRMVDRCMVQTIKNMIERGVETLGCCCGHGRYSMTVVVEALTLGANEHFSGEHIPRTRRFYRQDSAGYFYIPEVNQEVSS